MTAPEPPAPARGSRALVLGAGIVLAVYLLAASATLGLAGHRHRFLPLFEGVGPPPAYQWVKPPPAFEAGNIKPKAVSVDLPLSGPPQPAVENTSDAQFLVNFPAAPFVPHPPDTKVHATLTPLDPATLGPVPAGISPSGNAYRVELTYQPSAVPVGTLVHSGNVIVTGPNPADALLYSVDGRSWSTLASQHLGDPTMIGAAFTAPGYFLAGMKGTTPGSSHSAGTGIVAIGVVVGAVILGLIALWATARRRRT